MAYHLDTNDLGDIFTGAIPRVELSGNVMSKAFSFSKADVSFREESISEGFSIMESCYNFHENIEFTGWGSGPLLEMQFNLSGKNILYKNKVSKNELVKPMSGNIIFDIENDRADIAFNKDINYKTFDVHFPPGVLMRYQGESKILDNFLENIQMNKSAVLSDYPVQMNPKIWSVIEDIRNCVYSGLTRKIYLEGKVYELIALSYDSLLKNRHATVPMSSYEMDCIYMAEQLIRDNLDQPFTIPDLSRRVGINQTKLKQGFKTVFGTTIFDYLQQIRMEQARKYLLNAVCSVQEISILSGYNSVSNFSAAFKRTFGYPPTQLRK